MKYTHTIVCAVGLIAIAASGCVEEMKVSVAEETATSPAKARLYSPTSDELMEDPATGLSIAKEVIYITFRRHTSSATAEEIITQVGGVIVGEDPSSHLYHVKFSGLDLAAIDAIRMKLLAEHSEVEVASRLTVSAHKDPYYVR